MMRESESTARMLREEMVSVVLLSWEGACDNSEAVAGAMIRSLDIFIRSVQDTDWQSQGVVVIVVVVAASTADADTVTAIGEGVSFQTGHRAKE